MILANLLLDIQSPLFCINRLPFTVYRLPFQLKHYSMSPCPLIMFSPMQKDGLLPVS